MDLETDENRAEFAEGEIVKHEIFGEGTILSVNKDRNSCEVQFEKKIRNIQWKFLNIIC